MIWRDWTYGARSRNSGYGSRKRGSDFGVGARDVTAAKNATLGCDPRQAAGGGGGNGCDAGHTPKSGAARARVTCDAPDWSGSYSTRDHPSVYYIILSCDEKCNGFQSTGCHSSIPSYYIIRIGMLMCTCLLYTSMYFIIRDNVWIKSRSTSGETTQVATCNATLHHSQSRLTR